MPTYQYRCTECGHDLEAVQKFSDAALTVCPNCGGPLRKIFNAVGVVFKGSGFYRTDSRKSSDGEGGSAAKTEGKETAPKKEAAAANGTESAPKKSESAGGDKAPSKAPAASSSTGSGGAAT